MIRSLLLIKLSLFCVLATFSQQQNPLINSGQELEAGEKFYENQEYKKAIEHYSKIGSNDTNYVAALYELARSFNADSQYVKALEYCKLGIVHHADRERLPDFLTLEGVLYDNMNQPEKALKLFDSALVRYPAHTHIYINKGRTLFYQKKYAEASEVFKKALLINPYLATLHFNLGVTELKLGNPVCSFLALTTCLVMNPSGEYSGSSIRLLNNISLVTDDILEDVNKRTKDIPDAYASIEQIVLSKIAHERSYKPLIKLDDKISRQLQVILEKLTYDPNEKDFFMQYYVPYFSKIFAEKKFEVLVNYAFSAVDVEQIKKYIKDHKKEIKRFESDLEEYFTPIRRTLDLHAQKRDVNQPGYYFSGGHLMSKGLIVNDNYIGDCVFYYAGGNKKSEGRLSDKGEKTGIWKYYFPNGNTRGVERYENGKQEGDETYYYENGNVSHTATYKNNNLDGKKTAYYPEGNLKFTEIYKDGKLHGEYNEFYPSGLQKSQANYVNDKGEGQFTTFSINGRKLKSGTNVNGMMTGKYFVYFPDGSVSQETTYEKDQLHGTNKTYHPNGKIKSISQYSQGKLDGEYVEYYDNGQRYYSCIYVNGVFTGTIDFADDDGILFCRISYDKDVPQVITHFDKKGKTVAISKRENGKLYWASYSTEALKTSETPYDQKDLKNGMKKYFFRTGKISGTEEYVDNELHGKTLGYHPNGKMYYASEYDAGKRTGYYTEYSLRGIKKKEGWYVNDERQGMWMFYDNQGNISEEEHYWNGLTEGVQTEYWPNGIIRTKQLFHNDKLKQLIQYDTLGKQFNQVDLVNGTGKYLLKYFNGAKKKESTYKNGNLEGRSSAYFFDGTVESEQYYKGGLLDSVYRSYSYGGKLRVEGRYDRNQRIGVWKFYRQNGTLSSTEKYHNGEVIDTVYQYFENGKLSYTAAYKDGEKHGIARKYAQDGSLAYQLTYKEGEVWAYTYHDAHSKLLPDIYLPADSGKVKTYYADGTLSAEFSYENRKLTGADNEYHPNGKPFMLSTEYHGSTEGAYKQYYLSGKLKFDNSYTDNDVHGEYKEFYESGALKAYSNYYDGSAHGKSFKYDEKGKVLQTLYYYYGELISAK